MEQTKAESQKPNLDSQQTGALESPAQAVKPARLHTVFTYILIGTIAALLRMLDLGRFITIDEASFWLHRSHIFLGALRQGDFAATAITDHPGVTTMWLGSASLLLQDGLVHLGLLHDMPFPLYLALMQFPMALVHTVGVLLGYFLLRQMFRPGAAFLAALLWATEPFMVAFSRVLHVDGPAGTFITLSILSACYVWHQHAGKRWLVFSGVCAGLAVLSKSPSVALVPAVGGIALLDVLNAAGARRVALKRNIGLLLLWGLITVAAFVAFWPAMWTDLGAVWHQLELGVMGEGAQPHQLGNFFLGREDPAPGVLFYPAALVMRATPWALLGWLALPWAWRSWTAIERRHAAVIAGFCSLFIAAMSIFPKKFNRYIIPTYPLTLVLAALGLAWLIGALNARRNALRIGEASHASDSAPEQRRSPVWRLAPYAAIACLLTAHTLYWHPYTITYFSPLFGGTVGGERTFMVGWGEGLEQAADWLNQQPDITGVRIFTTDMPPLQPYLRYGAQSLTPPEGPFPTEAGYAVIYVLQTQNNSPWSPFDQIYGKLQPVHTVVLHNVPYVRIYQLPPPVAQVLDADFGDSIHLRGWDNVQPAQRGGEFVAHLFWQTRAAPGQDVMIFAHLLNAQGERVAQSDIPYDTSTWGQNRYWTRELRLPIPNDLPAGSYRLVIGLYEPQSGARLPVKASEGEPDALLLTKMDVR